MARYEITLEDGYKIRLNAPSLADACIKAESQETAKGRRAIIGCIVDDRNLSQFYGK